MAGFISYRYLAYTRTRGTDMISATTHKARTLAKSYSTRGYDEWQLHASYLTDTLVLLVGLASFQQAIHSFSASTQLIITGCLAMPLCSLSGFLAYVYFHRKQQPAPQSELIKQNKQKAAAGVGVLVAFTIGYIGLKSSIGIPLLIACFALPVCCIAGFAMFQYQLYQHIAINTPQPAQTLPASDNTFSDANQAVQYEAPAAIQELEHRPFHDADQQQQPVLTSYPAAMDMTRDVSYTATCEAAAQYSQL